MQISLRLRLDTSSDSIRVEFEPAEGPSTLLPLKIEGSKQPIELELTSQGYIVGVKIPGLAALIAAIAGEDPNAKTPPVGKPAAPGKPKGKA